jgi:hypothetical protein
VQGARCDSKGRLGLIVLTAGQSLRVRRLLNPRMYLSCTKDDLRLPWRRYVWVCVKNTAQLVAIDSNHRLS